MFGFNKSAVFLLALLLCGITLVASLDCDVKVDQTIKSSWDSNGETFTQVEVALTNTGTQNIQGVTLKIESTFESMWEMVDTKADNLYVLPQWRSTSPIQPGQKHDWGYIIKSANIVAISVQSSLCDDGSQPNPPTQPPQPVTDAPTQAPPATEAPTLNPQPGTDAPTQPATQAPTQSATEAPQPTEDPCAGWDDEPTPPPQPTEDPCAGWDDDEPTERPTNPPTQRPTERPTNPPTQRPTNSATQRPTERPTNPPTQRPTTAPTQKPTSGPTNAPGVGRLCPANSVWSPTPGTTWQWQITGKVDTSIDVQMYDIDLFSADANTISTLHRAGRAVICYFSTQYEDWRPDAKDFPASVLGNDLDDWEGEKYVDIRSSALRAVMAKRLDLAVQKGCDGVEPDNVDGYSNSNGFSLTASDQINYNKWLASESHKRGLSVGLKNDLSQVSQLVNDFDWALNEQCNEYSECDDLTPFVTAGKAVFGVEYTGSTSTFCPKMKNLKFSWWKKNLDLDASGTQCCTTTGGCTTAPYTCKAVSKRSIDLENETESFIAAEELIVEPMNVAEPAKFEQPQSAASSVAFPVLAFLAAVALVF